MSHSFGQALEQLCSKLGVKFMLTKRMSLFGQSKTSHMRIAGQKLAAQGIDVINFAAGELAGDTSPEMRSAAINAINEGNNKYTDTAGISALRQSVARSINRRCGTGYAEENIVITAGAKQALFNTAMVLFEEGDEVIVPSPYWTTFTAQIAIAEATPVIIENQHTDFNLNVRAVEQAISSRTKAIILNSPCNPTGVVYSSAHIEKITELARHHSFWIIFDECYERFVYDDIEHVLPLHIDPAISERLVLINSFSKSHAITGWRIGWMAAPVEVIKAARSFQSHTTSNANTIAQKASLAVLDTGSEFIDQARWRLMKNREIGLSYLNTVSQLKFPRPCGGFYFYLDLHPWMGGRLCDTIVQTVDDVAAIFLEKLHCATVSGSAFGDDRGLRLSYAISHIDLEKGLQRICGALNGF